MDVLERILGETAEGALTAVVGRPCAGKSTAMARICGMAARRGVHAVFASWEAAPKFTGPMVEVPEVAIPNILGWDLGELERWLNTKNVAPGSLIAVDYVQLVSDIRESGSLVRLSRLAREHNYRLLAGFMPRRDLDILEERPTPATAARMVGERIGANLADADRAVILCGTGAGSRNVVMSTPPAPGRVTWHAEWSGPDPTL